MIMFSQKKSISKNCLAGQALLTTNIVHFV